MHDDWFTGGVEDLDGLRDALGLDTINIVGHSAGAHLAALYAGLHPRDDVDAGASQLGPTARPGIDAAVRPGHGRAQNPRRRC